MVSKPFPDLEPPKGLFCTPSNEDHDPVFEISSKLAQNVWVVTKKGDPRKQQYLASPSSPWGVQSDGTVDYTEYDDEAYALARLLSKQNQAYTIRQILNHENLMSVAGIMEHQLFNKSQTPDTTQKDKVQLLVTDFADAGNLSALFRHYSCDTSAFYLPESLCWHVLRSLTRAVTYLHDGKRFCYPIQLPGLFGEWVSADTDWFPILHRRIEPRNIWLQHPRGTETYGLCKLGNFSSAAVTCHAIDTRSKFSKPPSGSHGMALAVRTGVIELDKARLALEKNPAELPESDRVYTLRDEMWSIGATVFTMMTGKAPTYACDECGCSHVAHCSEDGCLEKKAAAKGCDCALGGCEHLPDEDCGEPITRWPACPANHHCLESVINVHSYLARARYTKTLRSIVKDLLQYDPQEISVQWVEAQSFAEIVEREYRSWKIGTEEGRDYVDIEDDMDKRWQHSIQEDE
ncbi:hypothetical protein BKA59DRAFT_271799 [Fusarium tricinctum]|uniref:Protein kinase domain-containing protein n=1 Tax=Fusarium tricinctum TaxID=61284 RepID=A0A8K0RQT4_9HYPO|nr:hypothetical protein BKA59DRAFT_271799 [Fusarium tricinctum]